MKWQAVVDAGDFPAELLRNAAVGADRFTASARDFAAMIRQDVASLARTMETAGIKAE